MFQLPCRDGNLLICLKAEFQTEIKTYLWFKAQFQTVLKKCSNLLMAQSTIPDGLKRLWLKAQFQTVLKEMFVNSSTSMRTENKLIRL